MAGDALTLQIAGWDSAASNHLCMVPDAAAYLADWRRLVVEGEAQLWAVMHEGARIGSVVWEAVADAGGGRIHVLAAGCAPIPGQSLVSVLDKTFRALAGAAGVPAIGCETVRPGMVRRLRAMGWRCEIDGPGRYFCEVRA
jgi:hypothetical protein